MDSLSSIFTAENLGEVVQAQDPQKVLAQTIETFDAAPLIELRASFDALVAEIGDKGIVLLARMLQACPEGTPQEAKAFMTDLFLRSEAVREALNFSGETEKKAQKLAEALNTALLKAKALVDKTRANVGILTGQTAPAPAEDPAALERTAKRTDLLSALAERGGVALEALDLELGRSTRADVAARLVALLAPAQAPAPQVEPKTLVIELKKLPVADAQLTQTKIAELKRDEEREFRLAINCVQTFAMATGCSFSEMLDHARLVMGRFFMKPRKQPLVSNVGDLKKILDENAWVLNSIITVFNFDPKERPSKKAELVTFINHIVEQCAPDESPKPIDGVTPPAEELVPPAAAPAPAPVAVAAAAPARAGQPEDLSRRTLTNYPPAAGTDAPAADAAAAVPAAAAEPAPAPLPEPPAVGPAAPAAAVDDEPCVDTDVVETAEASAAPADAAAPASGDATARVDEPAEPAPVVEFEASPEGGEATDEELKLDDPDLLVELVEEGGGAAVAPSGVAAGVAALDDPDDGIEAVDLPRAPTVAAAQVPAAPVGAAELELDDDDLLFGLGEGPEEVAVVARRPEGAPQ